MPSSATGMSATSPVGLDVMKAASSGVEGTIDEMNAMVNAPYEMAARFPNNALLRAIMPPLPTEEDLEVEVNEETEPPRLEVCITDDGEGIDNSLNRKQASGHESKGIRITSERLGAAGSVKSEQLPEGGTRITLLIPVTYI